MKFSLKYPAVYCWILVNLGAFLAIGMVYFMAWRMGAQSSFTHEQMSSIIHSATKEQFTKFSLGQDLAVRGAVSAIYLILGCWLSTMVLNVGITLGYCHYHKRKASSRE